MDEEVKRLLEIIRNRYSSYLLVGVDKNNQENKTIILTMNPNNLKECIEALFVTDDPSANQSCNILVETVKGHIKDHELTEKEIKYKQFLVGNTDGLSNEEINEFLDRMNL